MAKLGVLHQLASVGEPIRLGQLAESQGCVKSNITKLIDRLEADGLVQRLDDPADRRSVLAAITPEGLRLHGQGTAMLEEQERILVERLTTDDCATLIRLVEQVVSRLE